MATVVVHADEARLSAQTPRHALTGNWRLVLVRGIAALAVGVATLLWPHLALFTLVVMWGIYLFVDGLAALAAGLVGGHMVASHSHWWLTLAGLASVIAGIVMFAWPGITARIMLTLFAVWAVAVGATQLVGALQVRRQIPGERLLPLGGLVSIVFGLLVLAQPGAGALALAWLMGAFAILLGLVEVGLALEIRHIARVG